MNIMGDAVFFTLCAIGGALMLMVIGPLILGDEGTLAQWAIAGAGCGLIGSISGYAATRL